MKIKTSALAVLLTTAWIGLTSTVVAAPDQYSVANSTPGYTISKNYTLNPGDPGYDKAAQWIREKRIEQQKAGAKGPPDSVVGTITIEVKNLKVVANSPLSPDISAPPPPGPLPTRGTIGEQYVLTQSTRTTYDTWTYEWVNNANGSDAQGWQLINYQTHLCLGDNVAVAGGGVNCSPN